MTASELLLSRIGALGTQVPLSDRRELIRDARALYGNCVSIPDLNKKAGADQLMANVRSPSLSR